MSAQKFWYETDGHNTWIVRIESSQPIGRVIKTGHGWRALTMTDACVAPRLPSRKIAAEALFCRRFGNPDVRRRLHG